MTMEQVLSRQKELSLIYQGQLDLYRTACMDDDKNGADIIRLHLHTLMAEMYDCIYLSIRLMVEANKNG